jgi:hypothetical protein
MNTRLDAPPIRTAEAVYQRLIELGAVDPDGRPGFLKNFVATWYEIGPLVRLSPDWAIVQAAVETGHPTKGFPPFISTIYRTRGNIGGIGVTDNYDHGYGFPDGRTAALAHAAHLYVYVYGNHDLDPDIVEYVDLDPRWDAVVAKGWAGTVTTVDDLSGKWATATNYGAMIRDRFPAIIDAANDTTPPAGDGTGGTGTEIPMATKPYILLVAGHRSYGDGGSDTERQLTDDLAVAYTRAFRAAGYEADWWQRDLDQDSDPTMTYGGLDAVALGCERVLAARPKDQIAVMLDLHYNGPHSPFHVIVPDTVGLHTAYAGGAPAVDTAANNTLDVAVAEAIAAQAVGDITAAGYALGMYVGRLGVRGVMSERDTGVALQYSARLAMFAATARSRETAVRLVVEHGGHQDPGAKQFDRFAAAAVAAIGKVFETATETDPHPVPDPPVTYKPAVAPSFWGALVEPGGATYALDKGTLWYRVDTMYRVKQATKRQQFAVDDDRVVGPPLTVGETFRAVAIGESASDNETWIVTPWMTRVRLDDLEYVGPGVAEAA